MWPLQGRGRRQNRDSYRVYSGHVKEIQPVHSEGDKPWDFFGRNEPGRKRRPSSREDGGVSGVSSSCGARGGFLPRHDEDLREPLLWCQGSQVSMLVARGSASLLSQPTPVFLPGESHGQRSLAGYSPWGCPTLQADALPSEARSKSSQASPQADSITQKSAKPRGNVII